MEVGQHWSYRAFLVQASDGIGFRFLEGVGVAIPDFSYSLGVLLILG
jgi:hypothetical protein